VYLPHRDHPHREVVVDFVERDERSDPQARELAQV